jgi:hypothetical protein
MFPISESAGVEATLVSRSPCWQLRGRLGRRRRRQRRRRHRGRRRADDDGIGVEFTRAKVEPTGSVMSMRMACEVVRTAVRVASPRQRPQESIENPIDSA